MELVIRRFDPESNLAEQRLLFKDCFPEGIGTPAETSEHYYWKFHSCPHDPKSFEYGAWAKETNTLVGYYAAIPYSYRINGQTFVCGMVCDAMTHSSARKKGVFTRLGEHLLNDLRNSGVPFATGYVIRPEVMPGHFKVGWQIGFQLPVYIKLLKANAFLEARRVKLLTPAMNVALRAYNFWAGKAFARKESYSVTMRDAEGLVGLIEYDQFFADWSEGQRHVLVKDKDFWKWRLGAPGTEYRIVCIYDAQKLIALAVTRRTELKNIPTLAILDLMVLPGHERCLPYLHHQIELSARELKAEAIGIMLSRTWATRYRLLAHGFLRSSFAFKLIFQQLSEIVSEESLSREENWHLMWVDSDDL